MRKHYALGAGAALLILLAAVMVHTARSQTVSAWTMAISINDSVTLDLAAYAQLKPCTPALKCTQTWQVCNIVGGKPSTNCITVARGGNTLALIVNQAPSGGLATTTQVGTLSVQMPQQ
ncbi:MAG TPA: hypothetical protein VGT03_06920 [Candidatus Acidoferrales bacterium]|nr:hypothetical protein [Candidatus Acidoferrales bacterium]